MFAFFGVDSFEKQGTLLGIRELGMKTVNFGLNSLYPIHAVYFTRCLTVSVTTLIAFFSALCEFFRMSS